MEKSVREYFRRYVSLHACLHVYIFAYECKPGGESNLCDCAFVCVRDDGSTVIVPGGSSHPIVGGEHEARHLFFPKWIMKWSQARVILHTTDNKGQGQRSEERQNEAGIKERAKQWDIQC